MNAPQTIQRRRWGVIARMGFVLCVGMILLFMMGWQPAVAQEIFSNKSIGVTLTKPANWTMVSEAARDAAQGRDRDDFKDFIFKNSARQFLIMIKPGPRTIIPTISALMAPLSAELTKDPISNLDRMSGGPRKGFKEYKLIEKARSVKIGGLPGAYNKATYVQSGPKGTSLLTNFESWHVVRGGEYFLIGVVTAEPIDSTTKTEIQEFFAGLKIAPER